jgi:hypothetical protein
MRDSDGITTRARHRTQGAGAASACEIEKAVSALAMAEGRRPPRARSANGLAGRKNRSTVS